MVKSKVSLVSRIVALEVASGVTGPELGLLHYDQPSMQFTFKDQSYDVAGLTRLFKDKPCLFILAEPSSDSYQLGYCGWVWVVGEAFKNSKYASVEEFIEYLQSPPEPIDVARGADYERKLGHC